MKIKKKVVCRNCKANSLSTASLIYYRGLFRSKDKSDKLIGKFAPVNVAKTISMNEIRLRLPNGLECTFPTDLESSRIKECKR